MNYQLFMFDFDGTLIDSFPWFYKTVNELATQYQFNSISPEESSLLRNQTTKSILRYVKVPLWQVPIIAADIQRRMANQIESLELFHGVGELLSRLNSEACNICIISSNTLANVQCALGEKNTRLIDSFECGVSLFGKAKKIHKTLQRFRVSPQNAIYIGDETRDIQAAKTAGVDSGAVTWGFNTRECLEKENPTVLLDTLQQITSL